MVHTLDFDDADLFDLGGDIKLTGKQDWQQWSEATQLCLELIGYKTGEAYSNKEETKLAIYLLKTVTGDARLLVKGLTRVPISSRDSSPRMRPKSRYLACLLSTN